MYFSCTSYLPISFRLSSSFYLILLLLLSPIPDQVPSSSSIGDSISITYTPHNIKCGLLHHYYSPPPRPSQLNLSWMMLHLNGCRTVACSFRFNNNNNMMSPSSEEPIAVMNYIIILLIRLNIINISSSQQRTTLRLTMEHVNSIV